MSLVLLMGILMLLLCHCVVKAVWATIVMVPMLVAMTLTLTMVAGSDVVPSLVPPGPEPPNVGGRRGGGTRRRGHAAYRMYTRIRAAGDKEPQQ